MISFKFLTAGLLLICSTAVARVHIQAQIEVDRPIITSKRTISTDIQLDANKPSVIYSSKDLRIEATVLVEKETEAVIRCSVFSKNPEGVFECAAEPALVTTYGKTATVSLGEKSASGTVQSLAIALKTHKV